MRDKIQIFEHIVSIHLSPSGTATKEFRNETEYRTVTNKNTKHEHEQLGALRLSPSPPRMQTTILGNKSLRV